jgi:hypothetical protein
MVGMRCGCPPTGATVTTGTRQYCM